MKRLIITGIACMAALAQVNAGEAKKEGPTELKKPEASIPFLDMKSSITTWQADGEQGLWVQDARKEWYYARTFGRCDGLEFAFNIGIKTRNVNRMDRDSEIVVPNGATGACALQSFTKSEPPPVEKKKK
jgi:hypothetical protein